LLDFLKNSDRNKYSKKWTLILKNKERLMGKNKKITGDIERILKELRKLSSIEELEDELGPLTPAEMDLLEKCKGDPTPEEIKKFEEEMGPRFCP
jgi:hypothetical protein